MKFAPFWARGEREGQVSWRWSFQSAAEAQALADQAAQQLADRIRHRDFPQRRQGYYPERPFREPVLREFKNAAGDLAAVVTRNSYGCHVLNTARVMFVDVDLPEPICSGGFLQRLFGKPEAASVSGPQNAAIAKAEAWAQHHPEWGWRIYRTRAGLRLLATHAIFDPASAASAAVFEALGADPLYRQLCKAQKCFRARLTPKPWRCGVHNKPERWPFPDAKAEARFGKWESAYKVKAAGWATCQLLRNAGNADVHPEVRLILGVHDEATMAASKLALA